MIENDLKNAFEANGLVLPNLSVSGELLVPAAQRVIARQPHHQGNRLQHQQKYSSQNETPYGEKVFPHLMVAFLSYAWPPCSTFPNMFHIKKKTC